ncbi:MAG: hypothetical protein LBD21_03325 [Tannerellaceae bacterium]|jgi:hypothetical protein|nr:hypothetical protein [Tannerellaceae bacterium]
MKNIRIPYLPALNELSLQDAGALMETGAARSYIDVVNWKEFPYMPVAVFDIARGDDSLFIRFFVKGMSLKATCEADGSPVYTDSCVEFFMQRPGERTYRNFEFNCIGVCDASRRVSKTEKASISQAEYASISRYSSLPTEAFEEIKGIHAWELTVAIPFRVMDIEPGHLPEKISANFYHCADGTELPRFISWNPIHTPAPDFHRPEFFGELHF